MKNNYCVYIHTTPDGRKYVGITCNEPETRWDNGHGYKANTNFFNAIVKYGWINIQHEIIATNLTKDEASQKEGELIRSLKTDNIDYGFNNQTGGTRGFTHNAETRKRIAETSRERWQDPEYRNKLVEKQKTIQNQPEIKRRKSEYAKKRYYEDADYRERFKQAAHNYRNSDEAKHIQSERAKSLWQDPAYRQTMHDVMTGDNNPCARAIAQYSLDGTLIAIYSTCKEGADAVGVPRSSISSCARGRQKKAGGYVWRYTDVK